MRKNVWILLVVGVLACGLLVAACGDSDDTSGTEVTAEDSDASTTVSGDDTSVTSEDTSGGVDTEAFLSECTDAVAGTPAETAGTSVCQQAADALEECAGQAGDDAAVEVCQQAADQAVKSLQAAN
jgi:hypothetical protein